MADQENLGSTGTETGAGSGTSSSQGAESTSQEAAQGQSSDQAQVESTDNGASSSRSQERSENNFGWAQSRNLEKRLNKAIQDSLAPILERLNSLNGPSAPRTEQKATSKLDYNDLPGSIDRLIQEGIQRGLDEKLKGSLSGFEKNVDQKLGEREARTFLRAQVGTDPKKLEDIENIMEEYKLGYAAIEDPLGAVQTAVKIWKDRKGNPNVPSRAQLSTVNGGTVNGTKAKPTMKDMLELQKKLTGNLPIEEKAKIEKQVNDLIASLASEESR